MKKSKKNYLDLVPERNPDVSYEENDGIITLKIENKGIFNTIAQKVFKRPRISNVHLDMQGSHIWPLIDGKLTITELADLQKARFGESVEPLYPRFVKYVQIMESHGFIRFIKKD